MRSPRESRATTSGPPSPAVPASSLWVHPLDMHPNEVAHRLAAESLAPVVAALPD